MTTEEQPPEPATVETGEPPRQYEEQYIEPRESADLPTLIVGDFNDWRNNLAAVLLAEHQFEHVTGPPSRFRSFPAFYSVLAVDKAFHRGGIHVREARLVRTPLARRASDHLPLVIDFHLPGHHPAVIKAAV